MTTRRRFLGSLGVIGRKHASRDGASGAAAARHARRHPPPFLRARVPEGLARLGSQAKYSAFPAAGGWSRASSRISTAACASAILSLASTPGVWFDAGAAEANRIQRLCNEYAGHGASIPAASGCLRPSDDRHRLAHEIEYAFDTLKADGVGLQTNYGDKWPGDPFYKPVFEELNRRKAVVYFHPAGRGMLWTTER